MIDLMPSFAEPRRRMDRAGALGTGIWSTQSR